MGIYPNKSIYLSIILALAALPAQAETEEESVTLAEVTVNDSKDADDFSARRNAKSTKLIYGREELDRMNELTVGDYLRRLPGVTFTGPPGNPKDVRMRGMDKGYTQILIDGQPIPGGGKERQIQVDRLPLDLVERVEIIRAPTADMPNEGLMGTINIVLRQAPSSKYGSARLVAGRIFGEEHQPDSYNLSGQYGDSTGRVRWLMNASVGERKDVKAKTKDEQSFNATTGARTAWINEFEDETTDIKTLDFSPRININVTDSDELILSPFVNITDEARVKDVALFRYATPATGINYVPNGSKLEVEDKLRTIARLRADWQHKLDSGGLLTLQGVSQTGGEDKDKTTTNISAAGVKTYAIEDAKQDGDEWWVGVRLVQPWTHHNFNAGLEYGVSDREDEKTTTNINAAGVKTIAALARGDNYKIDERRIVGYLSDEIRLNDQHYLTPGVRAQRMKREAEDAFGEKYNTTTSWVTPSVHYLWQINPQNNFRASVTEAVKPAKFDDLSPVVTLNSANSLGTPDTGGNPNLKPESAVAYEIGFEHFLPKNGGVLGINYFYRDIEDKIESRTNLEGTRFVQRPFNVGSATVRGWEFDARPRMDIIGLPELMLRFNYTRLYSSLEDTATGRTTRIKDQAPYVYNVGFDWQLPQWDAAWGLNYNYTPSFIKNPAEIATKLDPEAEQKLLDMYFFKRINKKMGLRVTVSNMLDMAKDKNKYEFSSTTGRTTKYTEESEFSGRTLFFALEARL